MSKILVTGATGFVGMNLIPYLKKIHTELETINREDLYTEVSFAGCEVFIHLAGKAHDLKKTANPEEYYNVNYELTKKLYESFLKSGAKKFIFISSVKATADAVDGILTEETQADPKTHYGKSKLIAETYIQSQPLPEGKFFYILRPCMIHGPGNKGNLNLLHQLVAKGLPWPLGAFENQRSFLSIENLCFVIKELLENAPIPSGIYQVSDDKSLSTNELIQLLGTSLGKKTKIWKINISFIKSVAKLGDFIYFPLNSERLQKLTENYVVSNEKIVKALRKSLPVSAEEGLRRTFMSFRK